MGGPIATGRTAAPDIPARKAGIIPHARVRAAAGRINIVGDHPIDAHCLSGSLREQRGQRRAQQKGTAGDDSASQSPSSAA